MRRILAMVLGFSLLFLFCGCSATNVGAGQEVTLCFKYGDADIQVTLSDEEAARVIEILNGNVYDPAFSAVPSCGFDADISLKVGTRGYAIARDTCSCIQDLGNFRYFEIPQEDMEYIHGLFENHGGYFPCI